MNANSCPMTEGSFSLASTEPLARDAERWRLDEAEPGAGTGVQDQEDEDEDSDDGVSGPPPRGSYLQVQAVGPFGTAHGDLGQSTALPAAASRPQHPARARRVHRQTSRQASRQAGRRDRKGSRWQRLSGGGAGAEAGQQGAGSRTVRATSYSSASSWSSSTGTLRSSGVDSDGGYSSQDSCGSETSLKMKSKLGWSRLPAEVLALVFKELPLRDRGRCAQVCRSWHRAAQQPCLWRRVEFVLGGPAEPTPPQLVNLILEQHAEHVKFVVLRTDSSAESARSACHILARLVKCSLKTLALMSGMPPGEPPGLPAQHAKQFASALTLVLDRSAPSLRALAVDNSLVDDPSLQALAANSNGSNSLQLLRCKSCPRLSPGGVLALVDHCRCLRELSLNYSMLSDDLLLALSSELHARLEVLRLDVYTDSDTALRPLSPASWYALVAHSPQLNLVMHFFSIRDESFDDLFTSYVPVSHLYFGDYVPAAVLGRVGRHCPRLIELVIGANGNSVIDGQLLQIASNCRHLASLGLAECQVTCSGVVRLAEACGPRLAQFVVMEECLIEDADHDLASACARVSQLLARDWSPEFTPMW